MKKIKLLAGAASIAGLTACLTPVVAGCSCNKNKEPSIEELKAQFIKKANDIYKSSNPSRLQYKPSDLNMKVSGQDVAIQDLQYIPWDNCNGRYVVVTTNESLHNEYPLHCNYGANYDQIGELSLDSGVVYVINDDYIYYKNDNAGDERIMEMKINKYGYYEIFHRNGAANFTIKYNGAPDVNSKFLKFNSYSTTLVDDNSYILWHRNSTSVNENDKKFKFSYQAAQSVVGKTIKISLQSGETNDEIDSWTHAITSEGTDDIEFVLNNGKYEQLTDSSTYHFSLTISN